MTTTTLTPARTQYRALVAEVAARAKAILPTAVNGRVESAVKLVLAQDVTPQEDGSIEVGSSSDPLKVYRLVGTTCTCQDFSYGKAPEGWCAHRIAAGILKRVQELLPTTTGEPPAAAAADHTPLPAPVAPLPEATFSLTLKGTRGGVDALLTVRGMTAAEFTANLQAVGGLLDAPQPPAPAASTGASWCAIHATAMQENAKDGRRWFSHKTAQGWCKGRG